MLCHADYCIQGKVFSMDLLIVPRPISSWCPEALCCHGQLPSLQVPRRRGVQALSAGNIVCRALCRGQCVRDSLCKWTSSKRCFVGAKCYNDLECSCMLNRATERVATSKDMVRLWDFPLHLAFWAICREPCITPSR